MIHWTVKRALALAACAALAHAGPARADEGEGDDALVCSEPHELDKYKLLRRLSLDLRNQIPSVEEYEALDGADGVPEATVQAFIQSEGFGEVMRGYHEALLWPNVSGARIQSTDNLLARRADWKDLDALAAAGRGKLFRGTPASQCEDYEHVTFDPAHPGEFRPVIPAGKTHDGWRMVKPYWSDVPVKICAYDAQTTRFADANDADGKPIACNTVEGRTKLECGCGPETRFCYAVFRDEAATPVTNFRVETVLFDSMREQFGRAIDRVALEGRPYTDVVLSKVAHENGALAFWRKNIGPNAAYSATLNAPAPSEKIEDRAFDDEAWKEIQRDEGLHAGLLTLPAFLLRFQTSRGRVNRARIAFGCEHFSPPSVVETAETAPADSPCVDNPADGDITKRCTCRYCHVKLEPLAAHFGLFAEAGSTPIDDASFFPKQRPECLESGASAGTKFLCARLYVPKGEKNPGTLRPYQFADAHSEYAKHLAGGPRAFVRELLETPTEAAGDGAEDPIVESRFATCAVSRLFAHFVKRDLRARGDATDERELLRELARSFEASNWSLPLLAERIVSLPQYRRAR